MFLRSLLALTVVTLTGTVAASPVVVREPLTTVSITKLFSFTGPGTIADHDRARARSLREVALSKANRKYGRGFNDAPPVVVTNQATYYSAQVGVGTPPTQYNLLVDTGSSNTWVGAGKAYVKSSSSVETPNNVSVAYGSGKFSGAEFLDIVTLGPGLEITNQSIGVASSSEGFEGVDGILGLGPVDLTDGTLSDGSLVHTVTDNLYEQFSIGENLVAISFVPTTGQGNANGELSFGKVDRTKFVGPMSYVPITSTSPASKYWGIDQKVSYGEYEDILQSTAGIVDTGTTLILLATDAFQRYQNAIGGVPDEQTGLLKITLEQYGTLLPLRFVVGEGEFELIPDAQIWPRALNSAIGGDKDGIYLIVADAGSPSGQGLDFINGMTFLERFYSVYDTGNHQVGLGTTEYTYYEGNFVI